MTAQFISENQQRLFGAVQAGLGAIGYRDELFARDYQYRDWFANDTPVREIRAACFGRLPAAYDTALFGVATANHKAGLALVNSHRSLGSPIILELDSDNINVWSIGQNEGSTDRIAQLSLDQFDNWLKSHRAELEPAEFLRTKNLRKPSPGLFQGSLFAGLIPELEERIADILEPRLTAAFTTGMQAYEEETGKKPPETALFKLAFWMLTGKVFADRRHSKFRSLGDNPDPNDVVERVADHYKEPTGRLLTQATREAVFDRIWTKMDFEIFR